MSPDGLTFPLQRSFKLQAQNSSEHLVLGVIVLGVKTGKVYFEDQALFVGWKGRNSPLTTRQYARLVSSMGASQFNF